MSDREAPSRPIADHLIPLGLLAVAAALARLAGLGMTVCPALVPLVDTGELTAHPVRSLLLLHAQPSGFNAAMALLLSASAATGIDRAALAQGLFWLLWAAAAWLLYRLAAALSGSRLPLVIGAAGATLWRRRRRFERADWTALLAGLTLLWTLAVPCLTDGTEGNRIRFSAGSTLPLLAVYAAGRLLGARRRRARLAGA